MAVSRDNSYQALASYLKDLTETGTAEVVSGLTVYEFTENNIHRTQFVFADVAVALTDEAGVVAYGGKQLYTFPTGHQVIINAISDLDITKSSAGVNDTADGDFSVGTVTASNNGTLTSTEANIIASTTMPQMASGATTANGSSTSTETPALYDGSSTEIELFLNFLIDDADHDVGGTACNLIVNGTLDVSWVNFGTFTD